MRCSHLNRALVANEKNAAKTEYLGLMFVCFWLGFVIQILVFQVCVNQAVFFCGRTFCFRSRFTCESQLCDIVFLNELFGVVRLYSTALFVPSGFSDRRFETTTDLSFSKHVKTVLAKRQSTSNQSFRFGN